jgi:hypothetical protein
VRRRIGRQHGAIARRQALADGLTPDILRTYLDVGEWARTSFRGVYREATHHQTWRYRTAAAVLAGPEGTVASHLSAAALFGLASAPDIPHVTIPPDTRCRKTGLVAHRSPIAQRDRCEAQGIPATRPARTVVDCAAVLDAPALMAVLDPCLCRQLTTAAEVHASAKRISESGCRQGLPLLQEVLRVWTDGIKPGSPAEMRLLRRIERWGFPVPQKQVEVYDRYGSFVARVDLAWPERRAGLEYQGQEFHGPRQWAADDVRQARLASLGWDVEPVEKSDLLDGATRLVAVLTRMLAVPA